MSRTPEEIADEILPAFRLLLIEVAQRAISVGRDEAARDFRQKLAGILSDGAELPAPLSASSPLHVTSLDQATPLDASARAAPGTVKPVIEKLIQSSLFGLTTEEITARSGIKHNSVRGTLHTLKNEGKVERRGHRWFSVPQTNEAADNVSVGDPSAASEQEPSAQGGKARPGGGT